MVWAWADASVPARKTSYQLGVLATPVQIRTDPFSWRAGVRSARSAPGHTCMPDDLGPALSLFLSLVIAGAPSLTRRIYDRINAPTQWRCKAHTAQLPTKGPPDTVYIGLPGRGRGSSHRQGACDGQAEFTVARERSEFPPGPLLILKMDPNSASRRNRLLPGSPHAGRTTSGLPFPNSPKVLLSRRGR